MRDRVFPHPTTGDETVRPIAPPRSTPRFDRRRSIARSDAHVQHDASRTACFCHPSKGFVFEEVREYPSSACVARAFRDARLAFAGRRSEASTGSRGGRTRPAAAPPIVVPAPLSPWGPPLSNPIRRCPRPRRSTCFARRTRRCARSSPRFDRRRGRAAPTPPEPSRRASNRRPRGIETIAGRKHANRRAALDRSHRTAGGRAAEPQWVVRRHRGRG